MTPEEEKEMTKRMDHILSDFEFILSMAKVAATAGEAATLILLAMRKHAAEVDRIAMKGLEDKIKARED